MRLKRLAAILTVIFSFAWVMGPVLPASAVSYSEIFGQPQVLGVSTSASMYPTGSLVNDNGTIYLIYGLDKTPFSNWQAFVGLGYSLKNVVNGDLPNYTLSSHVITTANQEHPWGQFVLYMGTVYYINQAGLIAMPNPQTFLAQGGNWSWLVPANKYDLAMLNSTSQQPFSLGVINPTAPVVNPVPLPLPINTTTPTTTTITTTTPTSTPTTSASSTSSVIVDASQPTGLIPGGTGVSNKGIVKHEYGSGVDAYWIFEPSNPTPSSAPVVVFNHGFGAMDPAVYGAWIEHLVETGNIVIYPEYQDSSQASGLGPTYTPNAMAALKAAYQELNTGSGHVTPNWNDFAIIGHSVGGVLTVNEAALAASAGLPIPKAIMSVEPGITWAHPLATSTSLSFANLSAIAPSTLMLVLVGDQDKVVYSVDAKTIFDSTTQISPTNKNFIIVQSDSHGSPALVASHLAPTGYSADIEPSSSIVNYGNSGDQVAVSSSLGSDMGSVNALDYNGYWKLADGLLDAAFYGTNRQYALGNTPQQTSMGSWSDGTPITPLFVTSNPDLYYPNTFVANPPTTGQSPTSTSVSLPITTTPTSSPVSSTSTSAPAAAPTVMLSIPSGVVAGTAATVSFTAGLSTFSSTYTVDWGDGSTPTIVAAGSNSTSHTYKILGNYTISVSAKTSAGATGTAIGKISINSRLAGK
jgi:acetyl esterase/lipase